MDLDKIKTEDGLFIKGMDLDKIKTEDGLFIKGIDLDKIKTDKSNKMTRKIIFLAGLLIVLLIAVLLVIFLPSAAGQTGKVRINNVEIKVEIAKTPTKQYQGLSNQSYLCPDCGMLFIFPDKKERTFVRRDMMLPIDIIWINDEKIVKIDEELPPPVSNSEDGEKYKSGQPVNYVLEVASGFCRKNNIKAGDRVEYLE